MIMLSMFVVSLSKEIATCLKKQTSPYCAWSTSFRVQIKPEPRPRWCFLGVSNSNFSTNIFKLLSFIWESSRAYYLR